MSIRVLIVDDEQLVRSGFRMILESGRDIEVVGEATNGLEAIEATKRWQPDVVLMDVRMPRLDGVEATRRLGRLELERPARVLIITTFGEDEYVYEALRGGASGFLLKDTPPEDLLQAVRVIASGECLLAPSVTRRLIKEFCRQPPSPRAPPEIETLTEREREVLQLLARGLSNSEIAEELVVSGTTIKTHVAHLLSKLDLRDRVQAVVLAYESGLVEPGESGGRPPHG